MRVVDVVVKVNSSSAVSLKLLHELLLVLELHDAVRPQLLQLVFLSSVEVVQTGLVNFLEQASSMRCLCTFHVLLIVVEVRAVRA